MGLSTLPISSLLVTHFCNFSQKLSSHKSTYIVIAILQLRQQCKLNPEPTRKLLLGATLGTLSNKLSKPTSLFLRTFSLAGSAAYYHHNKSKKRLRQKELFKGPRDAQVASEINLKAVEPERCEWNRMNCVAGKTALIEFYTKRIDVLNQNYINLQQVYTPFYCFTALKLIWPNFQ